MLNNKLLTLIEIIQLARQFDVLCNFITIHGYWTYNVANLCMYKCKNTLLDLCRLYIANNILFCTNTALQLFPAENIEQLAILFARNNILFDLWFVFTKCIEFNRIYLCSNLAKYGSFELIKIARMHVQ